MTSLTGRNVRMAIQSIKSTKLRSFLTMVGIVIGVASVIVAVSLGEGVRKQIAGNLALSSRDVVSIRPGKLVNRAADGSIVSVNYGEALGANSLTDLDITNLKKSSAVQTVLPLSTISAQASERNGRTFDGTVIGTSSEFLELSGLKLAHGSFFSDSDNTHNVAVVGKLVAEQLFQENVPIGQSVILRGHEFVVTGVFDTLTANSLSNTSDLNRAIFIPYQEAKVISGNTASLYQILVKPSVTTQTAQKEITNVLTENHGGQQDFTVLTQAETLQVTGRTLTSLTSFVAGIAAISLIVGGIGIMNIMFVSVTERTREIGVRKSLGATNRQIYSQFLVESTIVSLVGGTLGVGIALFANFCLLILTDLRPVATLPIIALAVIVSMAVGMIFGTAPAVKAARKDPIQSLRYE